jgi:hypothetical protein
MSAANPLPSSKGSPLRTQQSTERNKTMNNEYRIAKSDHLIGLERKVKVFLESGYHLVGGVSVCSHSEHRDTDDDLRVEYTYAQAMISSENAN